MGPIKTNRETKRGNGGGEREQTIKKPQKKLTFGGIGEVIWTFLYYFCNVSLSLISRSFKNVNHKKYLKKLFLLDENKVWD